MEWLYGLLVWIFLARQKNWAVCLLNQILGCFLWVSTKKSLDKSVSDFYIYLEIGERFFKQVLQTLEQSVNKNIKIHIGISYPIVNLSSKKRIVYEKQLLV